MSLRHLLIIKQARSFRELAAPFFWTILCLAFGTGMVCFPAIVFTAAKRGLQTWWEIVLPSLLPFFIISELLMNLGFVSLLGRILEPVMKPLFNLPGCSGFILGVSYLSGSPLCAILTARLRRADLCTKDEGERLVAFTSNASPLFMLGAVSVGMFGNPTLGPFIALIHYVSNLLCGFFLKLFVKAKPYKREIKKNRSSLNCSIMDVFKGDSHLKGSSFGSLLGETVRNASTTLLTIGGFITLFSVLIEIIQATGIFPLILKLLVPFARMSNIDASLVRSLLYGFFEMTIGINEVSKSSGSLLQQLIIIEAILAWNGLSIHAQVAGMMLGTDLSIFPYLSTRILQVPLAVLLTYLFFPLLSQQHIATATYPLASGPVWYALMLTLCVIFAILLILILSLVVCFVGKCMFEYCRKKIFIIH